MVGLTWVIKTIGVKMICESIISLIGVVNVRNSMLSNKVVRAECILKF